MTKTTCPASAPTERLNQWPGPEADWRRHETGAEAPEDSRARNEIQGSWAWHRADARRQRNHLKGTQFMEQAGPHSLSQITLAPMHSARQALP